MIERADGDLLAADVDALVNPVNTEGVMGKGLALEFKRTFPENFRFYARACKAREVVPGKMLVFETSGAPKFIINFPTKRHWRSKSRLEDIERGLEDLVDVVRRLEIGSIAVPPLGCGLGGLDWAVVRPMTVKALSVLPDRRVLLFEPH